MATVTKTRTYATGQTLSASNYNDDRDEIILGVNDITNAQINAAAAIDKTKIAGTAVTLADTQSLSNKTFTGNTALGTWSSTTQPAFRGVRSGLQTIANVTDTPIEFNNEIIDTAGMHDNSTNPSRVTIPAGQGGYYLLAGYIGSINTVFSGERFIVSYRVNGVVVSEPLDIALYTTFTDASVSFSPTVLQLSAGQYVEISLYHAKGASVNVAAEFTVVKLF